MKRSNKRLKPIENSFTGELEERDLILIHTERRTEVGMQGSHTLLIRFIDVSTLYIET